MATESVAQTGPQLEIALRPLNVRPEDPPTKFPYEPFMPTGTDWLKDKVAIVTGGTRGFGLAIVRTLAANGMDVAITYKSEKSDPLAEQLERELMEKYGRKLIYTREDMADLVTAETYAGRVKNELGRIDLLVNNAGIIHDTPFARKLNEERPRRTYLENWDDVMRSKYQTARSMSEAVWPYMVEQGSGQIISIGSSSFILGGEGQANYNAANGALVGMTRTLASDGAKVGIRANIILPGFADTDLTAKVRQTGVNIMMMITPLGRRLHPQEIANTVFFLGSPLGSAFDASSLHPDGGMTKQ